jgi:rifampin ADP-ribosylating transferase
LFAQDGQSTIAFNVTEWQGHTQEQLTLMMDHLERLRQLGIEAIEE